MTELEAVERFTAIQDRLFRFAKSIMKSSDDAEDVVQDAFIRLIKSVRKDQQFDNFDAWCMKVTRNRAFDLLKSRKRKSLVSEASGAYQTAHEKDFTHKTVFEERWEIVAKCIEELPVKYKNIIHLRDIEGFKYQEIADMTGTSLSQVKVSIHRARQHLKERVMKRFKK